MAALSLVKNERIYWDFIRELRNLDGIREGFIQQEHIDERSHYRYMMANNDLFYICLDNNDPIGYIGIINQDIRVATHPDYQGRGIATFMVDQIMKKNPQAQAKVKIGNSASLALFKKCGFKIKYYLLEK